MTSAVAERMVESAIVLLAKHGFQKTSFSDVLAESGAPRGSIYHHFPGGKEQLIAAAMQVAGSRAVELIEALRGMPATDVVDGFMMIGRVILEESRLSAGCSIVAVTVSSGSDELLEQAGVVFRSWQERLAELLQLGGMSADQAGPFATLMIASSEGGIVLSRAQQSLEPFDAVHRQLRYLLDQSQR
jgi:TetR/AcrR family transcriptional repressor of lmrAB and yxaGH operons